MHFRCTQQLFTTHAVFLHKVPTLNNKHHNTANCKQLQHTDYSAQLQRAYEGRDQTSPPRGGILISKDIPFAHPCPRRIRTARSAYQVRATTPTFSPAWAWAWFLAAPPKSQNPCSSSRRRRWLQPYGRLVGLSSTGRSAKTFYMSGQKHNPISFKIFIVRGPPAPAHATDRDLQ